jgi:hypothetical protein
LQPSLRAYVGITGIVFALMFIAHVARVFDEGTGILREPTIIATSVISLGLTIWAVVLLMRRPRSP